MSYLHNVRPINWASCTKFSSIFNNTYWGGFTDAPDPEVIKRRNKFVEDFQIDRVCMTSGLHKKPGFMDHVEVYITTTGKWIIICSPYPHTEDYQAKLIKDATDLGFSQLEDSLYGLGTISFIQVFSCKKEYNTFARQFRFAGTYWVQPLASGGSL